MPKRSEADALAELENRLSAEFSTIGSDQIRAVVNQAQADFTHSPIRDFIPLLVERRVRTALTDR